MKIAFLTMQLGPGYRHGTERYVETLGTALGERGHRVSYLAGDPRGAFPSLPLGAPREPGSRLHAHPVGGWMSVVGPARRAAGAWLARERPDLVHVANPAHVGVAIVLEAQRRGIPVVATAMDFWWVCPRATLLHRGREICDGTPGWRECIRCVSADHPRRALRGLARLPPALAPLALLAYGARGVQRGLPVSDLRRWTRRRAALDGVLGGVDQVIFPSSTTRDAIRPRLGHHRWQLIPFGLEAPWFREPRAGRTRPYAPEELTVGFAGSLQPHKGPHVLLEALRRLDWRRTRVRLAGAADDPGYEARLRRGADGLAAEFAGALDPVALRAFLRGLDVLVVPSLWPENLPFVLLEAQAAGLPVIASDVAGVADRVPEKRLCFAPGDATALAGSLRAFSREPALAVAPPRVSTLEEMTDATLAVYQRARAVARPGASAP